MRTPTRQRRNGFGLLEVIMTLGILSLLLLVVLSLNNLVQLQKRTYREALARQLLAEESEALRAASFASLTNRTDVPFIEVAYNLGTWLTAAPGGASSSPNVLTAVDALGDRSQSRIIVPTGKTANGTFEFDVRVASTSPSGWQFGMYLRYHDERNYYLLRYNRSATRFEFVKHVDDVETTVGLIPTGFPMDDWAKVSALVNQNSFTFYLDEHLLNSSAFVDGTFTDGAILLGAMNGVNVEFDNVRYVGTGTAQTLVWNFDADPVGETPPTWRRAGPKDLEQGATSVTIANEEAGFTDIKRATLSVSWFERDATRTVTNTIFLNDNGT